MLRLITDIVTFKEILADDYENEEVHKKWSAFGGRCLDITSKYNILTR